MPSFAEYAVELGAGSEDSLPGIVAGIVGRIRKLSVDEQQSLLQEAMAEHRRLPAIGENWDPRRTLVSVVLHAVRVREIESADQRQIRAEITSELAEVDA